MFILKKFQKQNSDPQHQQQLLNKNGHRPMDQYLQKKFARGIQYNMKIIIRGDRNVGKTCLYYRLQGDKFHEEYVASEEIKVASIQWNYNATDDVVKVEIWDVVDKGKKREIFNHQQSSSTAKDQNVLKMHNNNQSNQNDTNINDSPALDAEFVDVYKGTNGVIFLFDMTKSWTFDYIQREIHHCPRNIPILILANHRDMGHHRSITSDQVHGFIESIIQEDQQSGRTRTGQIRYSECSMRNGFGLRYLYKFFNLPYLHLQRETMLKQLERNHCEMDATCQELDTMLDNDDYDNFLEMLTNKRRMMADQLSATKTKIGSDPTIGMLPSRSVSMPANMSKMMAANGDHSCSQNHQINSNEPVIVKPMPSIIIGANNPLPAKFQQQFQKTKTNKNPTTIAQQQNNSVSMKNLEDFIPDDGEQNIFRKFLDEPNLPQSDLPPIIDEEDTDDDDTATGNNHQIVAKYQEELDPEDLITTESIKITNKTIESTGPSDPVKSVENRIDSVPEDHHVDDDEKIKESQTIESNDENQQQQNPVLNIDEIEELENMYISKHSSTNQNDNPPSSSSITINEKSSINGGVTKKKKKSSKISNKQNGDIQQPQQGTKKKKSTKLKTKNQLSSSTANVDDNQDDDDNERKQLEEFLGTTLETTTDKADSSRDYNSYQMF
ncbi:Rab-like protein 6 [Dermatophagoides pteronyssinus]|uniref:Rab-like protein 6 n=1 Tax=Dermatophagoides pteronyssinus TaxID=6956 RepID=A0ABQ8JSI6_DERPT|nr:Rab-like protein 6 [Dermatophagoides pteronyssinus]